MKNKLYTLCDLRSVEIAESEITEFEQICTEANVKPVKGETSKGVMRFTLPEPINDAEARVVAGHAGLLGEYEYYTTTKGMKPFEALAEWDLV